MTQSGGRIVGAVQETEQHPALWRWPVAPATLRVYDKYADVEGVLRAGDESWEVPTQGKFETFRFHSDAAVRNLQQRLVFLAQTASSPPTVAKFTRSLLNNWSLYEELLLAGPDGIKREWGAKVSDVDVAKAGKSVLKLACQASAGPWRAMHIPVVRGLEGHSKRNLLAQKGKIRRREKLLTVDVQAAVTHVLDEAGYAPGLSEAVAEGLTALALIFQHGVRPVQVLALHANHVERLSDANGAPACLVSFHAAKQRNGKEFEITRQVKPEWVGPVAQLQAHAIAAGRKRLFSVTGAEALWACVKRACREFAGRKVTFTAGVLRHTSAQALADAGHSRESIRRFLGQKNLNAAITYLKASRRQGELTNRALGASKLYGNILSLANATFVSVDEMLAADEDKQIAGVVGDRMVAGLGLCKSGQPSCPFNPVTSCYGCRRFMPSLDRKVHEDAVAGMRSEVRTYLGQDPAQASPASLQLTRALAGAQQALVMINARERKK